MGQTVLVVGAKSNDGVATNDKFRVTWRWTLSEFGSGSFFDSRRFDLNVQEALPALGFLPASQPAAQPGDEVIVYDVRLLSSWGTGRTVADMIAALDKLPFFTATALDVARVEKISPNATSAQLLAGQAAARAQGNIDSTASRNAGNPFTALGNWVSTLGTVTVLAVAGIAGIVAYTWSRR